MPNTVRKELFEMPESIYKILNSTKEPVRIIKEGHSDVIIMDAAAYEEYEKKVSILEIVEKLEEAEDDIKNNRIVEFQEGMTSFAKKHGFKL